MRRRWAALALPLSDSARNALMLLILGVWFVSVVATSIQTRRWPDAITATVPAGVVAAFAQLPRRKPPEPTEPETAAGERE